MFQEVAECLGIPIRPTLVVVGAPLLDFPGFALARRMFLHPRQQFTIAFAGCNLRLERLWINAGESKPMPVHRTVVYVFTGCAGDVGAALVEDAREDDIATETDARTARRALCEIGCVHWMELWLVVLGVINKAGGVNDTARPESLLEL